MTNKIGFFHKTKASNKELIVLFEEIQKLRGEGTNKDWEDKRFIRKLTSLEKIASKRVIELLEGKKLKTADDFLRAADIFHHGKDFNSYMIAVALAALSNHLGEPWGKNHYAVAVDRLFLSLGLPQHFGSHFIRKNGKYVLNEIDPKTTDKERVEYSVEPLNLLKVRAKNMGNITSRKTELKGK